MRREWSGPCGTVIGARVPVARLRPRRRRTVAFLTIQPQQLLVVHGDPLPRQQDAEPPVAEAPALAGTVAQPLTDLGRVGLRLPPHGLRVDRDQPAGPPLREALLRHQAQRGGPACRRRSLFFLSRSLSADTSSIDSASSYFSRLFSSSSDFSRLASDGDIPPYFAAQR